MQPSQNVRARAIAARTLAVLTALAAGLALLACGGAANATDPAASQRANEERDEAKAAKFAKCLREHGIQARASTSGGGFSLQIHPAPGAGVKSMEAAQNDCRKYRPEPKHIKLSPQERVKREEEVMKFAKCMREHGVNLHVEVGGGKVSMGIHGAAGSGPNPESPAFQAAQKACAGDLPFKLKGGPGPVGKAGGPSGEGASTGHPPSGGGAAGFQIGG